jgi:Holliday junction resolvase
MTNSRQKGKRGELELAHFLEQWGYEMRRGQQYSGSNGDADVVGIDGLHIECKRTNNLRLYDAMEQSKNDARLGEIPVVMHRRDRGEWLCTLRLTNFMELWKAWEDLTYQEEENEQG